MSRIMIYNANICNEQYLFYEMRIVAKLVCEGMSDDEIIAKVCEENLFQKPTERKLVELTRNCLRRLKALESDALVDVVANGALEAAKQTNIYGMMRSNLLVWDFMTTVIGEKFRTQDFDYTPKDLNVFFFRLQEQSDTVAAWSDNTIGKAKQVLNKSLAESGYIDSVRTRHLNLVSIEPELEDEIRANNDVAALAAFNCFR